MFGTSSKKSIGILGAGAFGTSLAIAWQEKFNVSLFSCFEDHVADMLLSRTNDFFKDFRIPEDINIKVAKDLNSDDYDYLVWTFPIKPTIEILDTIKEHMNGVPVIICSKGLLPDSSFSYDLFERELPDSEIAYLSGPNFSFELAQKKISMSDIASRDFMIASRFSQDFETDFFKLLPTDDIIGVQISAAMKNIISIASGIIDGLRLGANAHAALISKGLLEMKTLGVALGAREQTFYGLCGVGDLVLTSSSDKSRNTFLGIRIAQAGLVPEELTNNSTCEGFDTVSQIIDISRRRSISLTICELVYRIIFEKQSPTLILDAFK